MSDNKSGNPNPNIRHDGYQPSETRGYQATENASPPTTLPKTGSSVSQPSTNTNTEAGNSDSKK